MTKKHVIQANIGISSTQAHKMPHSNVLTAQSIIRLRQSVSTHNLETKR